MVRATSHPRTHALAHALPRSAGFAMLQPASRPRLDATRILTMSGTLAINLIAMGLLMMPLAMPPPAVWEEPKPTMTIRPIPVDPVVVIVPVVPPTKPTTTTQPITQRTVAPTHTEATNVVVISETGNEPVVNNATAEETGPTTDPGNTISIASPAMQLEYLSAPAPKYPRGALMRHIEGTVLLEVLVGADGRPLEVTVSQTSGNRELDEAARSQVLKRWSFRPAMRNGQVVQAIGLVPIAFTLRR